MPTETFIIRSRRCPARSLLGRFVRKHSVDARQADSTYVVAAVVSTFALLLLHIAGWSFIQSTGDETVVFVVLEAVVILAYVGAAFVGRDPAIAISIGSSALTISRVGSDELTLPFSEIEDVRRVDARTFHRHYDRYAETRTFVNHIPDDLLLLRWKGTPVVLGFTEDDLASALRLLKDRPSVDCASSCVGAA